MRRLAYVCPEGEAIEPGLLSEHILQTPAEDAVAPPSSLRLQDNVDHLERRLIRAALVRTAGRRAAAARLLGISRNGLAIKMVASVWRGVDCLVAAGREQEAEVARLANDSMSRSSGLSPSASIMRARVPHLGPRRWSGARGKAPCGARVRPRASPKVGSAQAGSLFVSGESSSMGVEPPSTIAKPSPRVARNFPLQDEEAAAICSRCGPRRSR